MCFLVAFSASAVQGTATKRRTQLLNLNPTARLIKRKIRRYGQAVRQRSATPLSPVRFRVAPPENEATQQGCFFRSLEAPLSHRIALCRRRRQNPVRISARRASGSSLTSGEGEIYSPKAKFRKCVTQVLHSAKNCAIIKPERRWKVCMKLHKC